VKPVRLRGVGLLTSPRIRPRGDVWLGPPLSVPELVEFGGSGPTIAVTMDRRHGRAALNAPLVSSLLATGGRVVGVPAGAATSAEVVALADAVVLSGGHFDIHPRHYGQAVQGRLDTPQEARTELELALAREAVAAQLPVLGICGGLQALAVAWGGTLVQHLKTSPVQHEQFRSPGVCGHDVVAWGALAVRLGDRFAVNSTHHQGVDRVPAGWRVIARADDGVVEAMTNGRALGVQWHPERLGQRQLFDWLVDSADVVF